MTGHAKTLAAEGLTKSYDARTVASGVSLRVSGGEVVGLFGRSGSGKSTVFGMIAGSVVPDDGEVLLDGLDIGGCEVDRRARFGVGYLPQAPQLFAELSVEENLAIAVEGKLRDRARRTRAVDALLEAHSLKERRRSRVATLSGGERKRCEIAFVMSASPRFVLLDEPLTGLDPLMSLSVRERIRAMSSAGIGVLVTDHKVRDALGMVDRAYIIDNGQIIASGAPGELTRNEAVRYAYLGSSYAD